MTNVEDREEQQLNKYPESIMQCVRQRLGVDKYDTCKDEVIDTINPTEVFDHVVEWNGLIGYSHAIKEWIWDIFKIHIM